MINKQYRIIWRRLNKISAFIPLLITICLLFTGCKIIREYHAGQLDVNIILRTGAGAAEINKTLASLQNAGIYFEVISDLPDPGYDDVPNLHICAKIKTGSELSRLNAILSSGRLPVYSCLVTKSLQE